ncbi:hypothetical protein [Burkholderia cenocepacia]|uniref:hypothetical protein n=1 Tax=Burkholderia cenocepacia TaxID=95486 RepID=UPI00201921AD|nr:hypothetical protein [Burkholderia cenocepacia]MCO1396422.1 hypothetical protein [Burkholderia cenocepacia]MCO1408996.1 hypothetical protein [Burkholderia cenocepacia]UQN92029.1 hypothetical protein L0Z06_15015 [Burkholderia cenocepacia]UQN99178.1 hypothetical protein L0Z39_16805 [Burkholderia cenocepacia]UQP50867.1 hypothetical protein L0Y99_10440 [Burkholderia cenocepacia]
MNLFNFGGTEANNPLLNALGSAPVGMFNGLNPAASAGTSIGALPTLSGPDIGSAPFGGSLAGTFANMDPAARANLGASGGQGGTPAPLSLNSWAAMLANTAARPSQPSQQQIPMGDYATPQAPVSSPNLIPMNQLVGRLLARGGA